MGRGVPRGAGGQGVGVGRVGGEAIKRSVTAGA